MERSALFAGHVKFQVRSVDTTSAFCLTKFVKSLYLNLSITGLGHLCRSRG